MNMIVLPRHTAELREASWQGKVLAGARGKLAAVAMSVVAHSLPDAHVMKALLEVVFPGYRGIATPFLFSCGRINPLGQVTAHTVDGDGGETTFNRVLFESENGLQSAFRALADDLKLSDEERIALFAAIKDWIVVDYRVDPLNPEGRG